MQPQGHPRRAGHYATAGYILDVQQGAAPSAPGPRARELIRGDIRRVLEVTRGCTVEMGHEDTYTVEHDRLRLETWARIAREEIDRVYP